MKQITSYELEIIILDLVRAIRVHYEHDAREAVLARLDVIDQILSRKEENEVAKPSAEQLSAQYLDFIAKANAGVTGLE